MRIIKYIKIYIYDYIMSTDKRQFLDPISSLSRIILLHFSSPNTKIKITNHTIQLTEPSTWESLSRTWYKDSRHDIFVLYPIFFMFIKLYLLEKKNTAKLNENTDESKLTIDELCYKYLKKLGIFAIIGIQKLQQTYGYDNTVFALQYFIELLNKGINGSFNDNQLPEHLKETTKCNLLDDTKVQKIWEDMHIIELGRTFDQCFIAEKNNDLMLLNANKIKILDILTSHDTNFVKNLETIMD